MMPSDRVSVFDKIGGRYGSNEGNCDDGNCDKDKNKNKGKNDKSQSTEDQSTKTPASSSYGEPMWSNANGFGGYKVGGQVNGNVGSLEGGVRGFGVEYKGNTEKYAIEGEVEVYGVKASGNATLGDDRTNASISVEGSALSANASARLGMFREGDKQGLIVGAEAGAYGAKGEFSPSVTLFGYKLGITIGGSVGSAHIGGEAGVYKDKKTGQGTIKAMYHIGLGVGVKFGFELTNVPNKK